MINNLLILATKSIIVRLDNKKQSSSKTLGKARIHLGLGSNLL